MSATDSGCERFYALVVAYLWRELDAAESEAIDEHRAGCAECEAYFAAAEDTLCVELYGQVSGYLDRELTSEEQARVERHLAICDRCRAHFEFDGTVLHFIRQRGRRNVLTRVDVERIVAGVRERIRNQSADST